MRRLLPAPKVRQPPVRRQEVTTVADAAAAAQVDADAAQAAVEVVQAAPVVTTAATAAFSGEQAITGTPDGTKFLRDDYSWQAAAGGGAADFGILDWLGW